MILAISLERSCFYKRPKNSPYVSSSICWHLLIGAGAGMGCSVLNQLKTESSIGIEFALSIASLRTRSNDGVLSEGL